MLIKKKLDLIEQLLSNNSSHTITYSGLVPKKIAPIKRDFQDHNPPRTARELYDRYDSSTGLNTIIILGVMLGVIVARISLKYVYRTIKKRLQKIKIFKKYFPANENRYPPLHVAERMAKKEGVQLSRSLLVKLQEEDTRNLHKIVHDSNVHKWVTSAIISPLAAEYKTNDAKESIKATKKDNRAILRMDISDQNENILIKPDMDTLKNSDFEVNQMANFDTMRLAKTDLRDGQRKKYSSAGLLKCDQQDSEMIFAHDQLRFWDFKNTILVTRSLSLDEGLLANV